MQFSAIFSQKYTGELLTRIHVVLVHSGLLLPWTPPQNDHNPQPSCCVPFVVLPLRRHAGGPVPPGQAEGRLPARRRGKLWSSLHLWPLACTPGLRARTSFSIQKDCGVCDRLDKSETKSGPDSASFTPTPALSVQFLLCPG